MKVLDIVPGFRSVVSRALATARALKAAPAIFKQKQREVKAEQKEQALSRAVRVRQLIEFAPQFFHKESGRAIQSKPAGPTSHKVRMRDGRVYCYFSDGSLRHVLGRDIARGKAARQAERVMRRERMATVRRQVAA